MEKSHEQNPLMDFRASLCASLPVLVSAFRAELITATVRLGIRHRNHPRGYSRGQIVTLRVLDGESEIMKRLVRIREVKPKPLDELTRDDLKRTLIYAENGWTAVHRDLSIFDGFNVDTRDMVSVVEFEYVSDERMAAGNLARKRKYPGLFLIYPQD